MIDFKSTRLRLRLSQSELARISGVSRFKICLHELGDKHLSEADAAAVVASLNRYAQGLRAYLDAEDTHREEA